MAMIPEERLPTEIMRADIDFCLNNTHHESVKVNYTLNTR